MKKLCSRWIPHSLAETRKTDHVTWCNAMLITFKEGAPNLVWVMVTVRKEIVEKALRGLDLTSEGCPMKGEFFQVGLPKKIIRRFACSEITSLWLLVTLLSVFMSRTALMSSVVAEEERPSHRSLLVNSVALGPGGIECGPDRGLIAIDIGIARGHIKPHATCLGVHTKPSRNRSAWMAGGPKSFGIGVALSHTIASNELTDRRTVVCTHIRWSQPPMGSINLSGGTSALPASWTGIEYLMEGGRPVECYAVGVPFERVGVSLFSGAAPLAGPRRRISAAPSAAENRLGASRSFVKANYPTIFYISSRDFGLKASTLAQDREPLTTFIIDAAMTSETA
ncbi:hypothetical protein EVAR_23475_1 [Eumeta japonica]|uniref:Uncharacterized protein n=1 Tax=Eumeta variegata TaxID=151549 RepID=A0A4C1ULG3_EUMVA|nr:hypothetical protein EVAR_23475_1 [Eumeta japonica]